MLDWGSAGGTRGSLIFWLGRNEVIAPHWDRLMPERRARSRLGITLSSHIIMRFVPGPAYKYGGTVGRLHTHSRSKLFG